MGCLPTATGTPPRKGESVWVLAWADQDLAELATFHTALFPRDRNFLCLRSDSLLTWVLLTLPPPH